MLIQYMFAMGATVAGSQSAARSGVSCMMTIQPVRKKYNGTQQN